MENYILKGNILYTGSDGKLSLTEQGFLVCQGGKSAGVYPRVPEQYSSLPVTDYGDKLIIPGMSDLHLHAGQYPNLGLGMDMELLDWLDTLTFPAEANFARKDWAETCYSAFTEELTRGATTRAAIFTTIHAPATELLMEMLEESGLHTLVGKVNMDRNSPDILRESSAEASLADTRTWLESCRKFRNTKPVLTPRFVPSCTGELMAGLGRLSAEYAVPVQSHLSENLSEIEWVHSLHPEAEDYASVYMQYGLLHSQSIMAHCVHMTEHELQLIKETGAYVAHCPSSNINVRSGIAPIQRYLKAGLNVGLGTDISGGQSLDMFQAMRAALDASKLYWRLEDPDQPFLKAPDVFRLATVGGGSFFGKVGSFAPGYELDALVVDDSRLFSPAALTLEQRFERMVYLCGSGDVVGKYVAGQKLF